MVSCLKNLIFLLLLTSCLVDNKGYAPGTAGIAGFSANSAMACAWSVAGKVRCWGYDRGLLGHGDSTHADYGYSDSVKSSPLTDIGGVAKSVSVGSGTMCALLTSGDIRCWGANIAGQLGLGNTNPIGDDETPASQPVVSLGAKVKQVSVGSQHACAVLVDGNVRCWGSNDLGQLGTGNTNNIGDDELPSSIPVVNVGGAVAKVIAGADNTCAILVDGSVRCWGSNTYGDLGLGHTNTIGDNESPASAGPVSLGGTVTDIVSINGSFCALMSTQDVRCWGYNAGGQLGLGNTNDIGDNELPSSVPVVNIGGKADLIAGYYSKTYVRLTDGTLRFWGDGGDGSGGQGNANTIGDNESPASVPVIPWGGSGAVSIGVASEGVCVLQSSGKIRCWGFDNVGLFGFGDGQDHTIGKTRKASVDAKDFSVF